MPHTPSPGFGISLPLGVSLHGALLMLLLYPSFVLRTEQLPAFEAYRVRLFAPPAAALREGDPLAERNPESVAAAANESTTRQLAPLFLRPDVVEVLDAAEISATFGAERGIPEGFWDGLEFGEPEGVVGGAPGGAPGGQIGGLGEAADPVLPPPDEPPAALSMPRPRFPKQALRDGVRGSVVLRALITERGTVEVVRILRSVPELDNEAIRVVEAEWRFRPAQRNGRPIASLSDLVVRFSLR
jgi:TonB family protein